MVLVRLRLITPNNDEAQGGGWGWGGGIRYIVTPGQNSVTKFGKINCPNLCGVIYESVNVLICMKVKFNSSQ